VVKSGHSHTFDDWRLGINTSPSHEVRRIKLRDKAGCLVAAAAQQRGGDG